MSWGQRSRTIIIRVAGVGLGTRLPQPVAHGNSKHKKPFYPTLPSTMAKIKEVSKNDGPKGVISKVYAKLGGVVGASDSCILPKNEQQVIKAKSRSKSFFCLLQRQMMNLQL